ncbi:MAG TPA: aminotransferase [Clostridiales bacterium]|nr:aminotransferase [Clostridiales bacterium]
MHRIGEEEIEAVARVIRSKNLFRVNTGNKETENFEKEWAQKCGTKYSLCVSGGTGALACALAGLEIGPGDEVIVPGYTFMATATAVLMVGAIPVIAEIDDTMTLDPDDFERKITGDVKAVIPVHIMGFPCNMDKINTIAAKNGVKVLEDACQAVGGSYKGKRLGSIGHAGAYSFNYYKNISAGEGGGVVTDDRKVYERALLYHDAGATFRPFISEIQETPFIGSQFRVSEITGAILRVQLQRLDGILADLRSLKAFLAEKVQGHKNITLTRSNDPRGDCGTTLSFTFPNEEKARAFAKDVSGSLPIDSGKHVYSNWDPVLNKKGGHHMDMNPFYFKQNSGLRSNYTKDMCPVTLDILKRTVYVSINIQWTQEELQTKANQILAAADRLG